MKSKQKKNKYKHQGNSGKRSNLINIVSDIKYVKETEIHLSDTALKSALLKSYERGVSDNKKENAYHILTFGPFR